MKEEGAPATGTGTILPAEDEELVRRLAEDLLEGSGVRVITAVDCEDAEAKFIENRGGVDLLLFDLVMPSNNGKEIDNKGAAIYFELAGLTDVDESHDF